MHCTLVIVPKFYCKYIWKLANEKLRAAPQQYATICASPKE